MIFIIEGSDGAGKSTLIKHIRDDKRKQCHFLSSSSQPTSIEEIRQERDWIHQAPLNMILFTDRYRLISEPIYGQVLRGKSLINDGVLTPDAVYIYCRPPLNIIVENLKTYPQLKGVHEHISEIVAAYDQLFSKLTKTCDVILYDYTRQHHQDFLDYLFTEWT